MLYYRYDGSFCGLMAAVYQAIRSKQHPIEFLGPDSPAEDLFGDYVTPAADEAVAEQFIKYIILRMGDAALGNIMYCYLSEAADAGSWIYNYIRAGLRIGKDIDSHLTDENVKPLHDIVFKVKKERYRMLGLVRFRLVEKNLYYAAIEPDHNITGLIAPHFARRLADQNWLIHDTRRNIAVRYDRKRWEIIEIDIERGPQDSDRELFYQSLWKSYFKNIAIGERKNPGLQLQFIPRRYWKNLVEMS